MRDLIFRGKRNDNWEWLVSDSIIQHPNGVALYDEVANDIIYVVPETVGQFTGLTDVNGKNIFEGDIVRCCGDIYAVKFRKGCWVGVFNEEWEFLASITKTSRIIGNIYDNEDLLH